MELIIYNIVISSPKMKRYHDPHYASHIPEWKVDMKCLPHHTTYLRHNGVMCLSIYCWILK